jgi:hypothetical protein
MIVKGIKMEVKIVLNQKNATNLTKVIAMGIRNSMEDFHCKHLSDEQMAELNPIIRNSIYTTLFHIKEGQLGDAHSNMILSIQHEMIPSYWEEPELEVNKND